jgi:hypothetical protein
MPRSVESKIKQGGKGKAAVEPRGGRKKRVAEMLETIEGQLKVEDMKVTLGDFIRLMQLERDLDQDEQPREIIVTWKDPSEISAG